MGLGENENNMSIAFTTPTGTTMQSTAFYNEIALAYTERSGISQTFADGDYWQKLSMYQTWQNWLEANCTSFVDFVSGPFSGDDVLLFTLATWRSAAGINASGFSRYDKDGNLVGYGIAQDDDLICNKTFLQIQNGFSALKWKGGTPSWSDGGIGYNVRPTYSPGGFDWTLGGWLQNNLLTKWSLYSGTITGAPCAFSRAYSECIQIPGFLNWYDDGFIGRKKAAPSTSGLMTTSHVVELYIRGTKPDLYGTPVPADSYVNVFSANGDGITESGTLYLQETSGTEITSTWTGSEIGSDMVVGNEPTMFTTPTKPEVAGYRSDTATGYKIISRYVVKYSFTNSNL